jgi:hypothetical protein
VKTITMAPLGSGPKWRAARWAAAITSQSPVVKPPQAERGVL